MSRTRLLAALGALALLASPLAAQSATQAEGRWMVRLRALSLIPADKSDAITSPAVPEDAITVSDKIFPELDIAFFFTPRWAAELVLTYPQEHDVELSGTAIGTFKHLPPTLLLQYHFLPEAKVRPYVGGGVNLTFISSVDIAVPGVGALDLEDTSIGAAGQAGVDIALVPGLFLNADVKKVMLRSDVSLASSGVTISQVKVDPWLISVGLGWRF